jgi:antitoxin ParD1/3/4
MPNVQLTDAMQDYAERQVRSGAYANVSEVVRAGMRKLMQEDGAAAFYRLKQDLEAAMAEPVVDVDLDQLFSVRRS